MCLPRGVAVITDESHLSPPSCHRALIASTHRPFVSSSSSFVSFLQHGRVAMLAIAGFVAQELVDGKPILLNDFGI